MVIPSRSMFCSRSPIGSRRSISASSFTVVSTANWPCVAPKPRYAPEGCMFVYTTSAVNLNASREPVYRGMDLCPVRPTVAQPCSPYAPEFDSVVTSSARMRPSSFAPRRTLISISWRGEPQVCASFRVNTHIAGRPVFIVTNAGYTSHTAVCFAPKPPPMRGFSTRMRLFGMPSAWDKMRRTWKTICVDEITCRRP